MTVPGGLPPALTPQPALYPPDSRYADVPSVTRTLPDGRTVTYLRARLVPAPDTLDDARVHTVVPLDRLDTLAAVYYGDSQLWWRIADANRALDPDALLVPGTRLRIPHPEGLPGVPL